MERKAIMTLDDESDEQDTIVQQQDDASSTAAIVEEESVPESKNLKRRRYFSLFISFLLMHTMLMQTTIYTSSLWPFLSQIDESATEAFLGYIFMIFNIVSAVSSPLFGMWSNRITQVKIPLVIGVCLVMFGNGLLLFVEAFRYDRKWFMLVSRSISGLGFGSYGLLYTYVVMATALPERNTAMTIRAIFNGLALFTGPGIQALFSQIGYPGFIRGQFHLNMYTAACLFNIVVGIFQGLALIFLFKEYWVSTKNSSTTEETEPIRYDRLAACVCIVIHGIILFSIGLEGSMGSPFTMLMFGWDRKHVLLYRGIIQASSGVLDPIATIFVGMFVLKYIKERVTIIIGILFLLLYSVIVLPWPGLPLLEAANMSLQNGSSALNICSSYTWCDSMTKISLWQYILGQVLVVLCLAAAFAPNVILFSKILGPTKQGISQGIFASFGFVGLGTGPIVGTNVFYYYGPRVAYAIVLACVLLILFATIFLFNRMVPYHMKTQRVGVGPVEEQRPAHTNLHYNSHSIVDAGNSLLRISYAISHSHRAI